MDPSSRVDPWQQGGSGAKQRSQSRTMELLQGDRSSTEGWLGYGQLVVLQGMKLLQRDGSDAEGCDSE